jgi:hypothetical protein
LRICGRAADSSSGSDRRVGAMTRSSLALLASVSFVALACGGEPQRSGAAGTTTREWVDSPSAAECEGEWPGPWTACPRAGWVREVAERAGYRVMGETGSALVAQGKGRSFYIWATDQAAGQDLNEGPTARRGPLGEVEGVSVYGDERLWRWWTANGFVLWFQAGPYRTSQIPRLNEMKSLGAGKHRASAASLDESKSGGAAGSACERAAAG